MSEEKTIEQRLIEEFGAEFLGTYVKLGEFTVMDGDEVGDELLERAFHWLKTEQRLQRSTDLWDHSVTSIPNDGEILTVLVNKDKSYTEYQFRAEAELHRKRLHYIGAYVFIPHVGEDA